MLEEFKVRLPPEMVAALKTLAARRGQPAAGVVRQAIAKEIGQAAITDGADAVRPMLKSVVAREVTAIETLAFRAAYQATLAVELLRDQVGRYSKSHDDFDKRVRHARARALIRFREPFSIGAEEAAVEELIAHYQPEDDA